jgi:hypothetical protein
MTPHEAFVVRLATIEDLPFVMALQRKNRESLGGLPSPAIEERIVRGTLLLGELNAESAGYLMFDYRNDILRIPQACIQYDARRRHYGESLVGQMMNLYPNASEIRLRVASDLDANVFWKSLGFVCVGTVAGGSRRNRLLNLWQKWNTSRLFTPDVISTAPAWQSRQDCKDEQTGFLTTAPEGFIDRGPLPKLAWSNRKTTPMERTDDTHTTTA